MPIVQLLIEQLLTESKAGYTALRNRFSDKYPEKGEFSRKTREKYHQKLPGETQTQAEKYEIRAAEILEDFEKILKSGLSLYEKDPLATPDQSIFRFKDWLYDRYGGVYGTDLFYLLDHLVTKDDKLRLLEPALEWFQAMKFGGNADKELRELYLVFYKLEPGKSAGTYTGWPPLIQPVNQAPVDSREGASEKRAERESQKPAEEKEYLRKVPGSTSGLMKHIKDNLCCIAYTRAGKDLKPNLKLSKEKFVKYFREVKDFRDQLETVLTGNYITADKVNHDTSTLLNALKNLQNDNIVGELYEYLVRMGNQKKFPSFDSAPIRTLYKQVNKIATEKGNPGGERGPYKKTQNVISTPSVPDPMIVEVDDEGLEDVIIGVMNAQDSFRNLRADPEYEPIHYQLEKVIKAGEVYQDELLALDQLAAYYYIVETGDTLESVAKKASEEYELNITPQSILKFKKRENKGLIRVSGALTPGTKLRVF